jgi:hypothetical protein
MKKLRTFVFSLLVAFSATLAIPSHARADVSVGFFYDSLSPYGDWVSTDDYGYCWRPSHVSADWRPYTDGYWAYTDDGWTWVSYEDYGGVVYHYGRWVDLDSEGWCWVPGEEWAPAWVSWRSNDNYVGWAPLPPEARFSVGVSFGGGVDAQFDIGPGNYSFCPVGRFGDPDLRPVIVNREENTTIINNTTNITNITVNQVNKTVYNGGPNFTNISRRTNKPIQRLNLVRNTGFTGGGKGGINGHRKGNSLTLPAPTVTRDNGAQLAPKHVAKQLGKATPNRGWKGVKDAGQRQAIKDKFQADAQRPQGAAETTQAAPETVKPGKGKGKKNKGEANLQPFMNQGANAAAKPDAAVTEPGAGKGKGKKNKEKQRAAEAAAAQDAPATQPFTADQPRKKKQKNNDAADLQAQQAKRERQAAAQAAQQDNAKAERQQLRQQQAVQADRQQQRANQAAKAERQQQAMKQQRQAAEQAQGAPQEGKKKKKKDKQDQQDNGN